MKILSVISERQLFLANLIVNIVFHYLMSILAVIPEEPQYKYTCLGKEEIHFYFSFRKIPRVFVFHLTLYHYKQCTKQQQSTSKPYTWTMYQGLKLVEVPRPETCCF